MSMTSFDCLKSSEFQHGGGLHDCKPIELFEADPDKHRRPEKTKIRPSNELFAVNWYEMSAYAHKHIVSHIAKKYHLHPEDDIEVIKMIFKVLITRNAELNLAYVESKDFGSKKTKIYDRVFDEEKFEWKQVEKEVLCGKDVRHRLRAYIGIDKYRYDPDMNDGYYTMKDSSLLADSCYFWKKGEKNRLTLLKYARSANIDILRTYLSTLKEHIYNQIENRMMELDFSKKNVFVVEKKDFMAAPIYFSDYMDDSYNDFDDDLVNVIKVFKLPTDVDQEFIDWVASDCKTSPSFIEKPGKKTKLNSETAVHVNNKYKRLFPRMGRGNVVEFYHGIPDEDFYDLHVGDVFSNKNTKYVVLYHGSGYDEDDNVIAYANLGTTIDEYGFVNDDYIMIGCKESTVEGSWDALYDINRLGKRKKILNNFKIVSKVS